MRYSYGKPKPAAATMNRLPAVLLFLAVALFIIADLVLKFDFNWVDYTMVIIVALFGLKGYIKGLVNSVFSLGGYLLGLVCALVFSPKVALLAMQKTSWGKSIGDKINELLPALASVKTLKVDDARSAMDMISSHPEFDKAISANPLLKQIMTFTNSAAETGSIYSETVVTINDLLVFTIMRLLAIVVLFIAVKLLVVLIGKLLTSVLSSNALLGTANRTIGMALGMTAGLLICYILFVFAIPTLASINIVKIPENYHQSIMLSWFNELLALFSIKR